MTTRNYGKVLSTSNTCKIHNSTGYIDLKAYLIEEGPGRIETTLTLGVGVPRDGMLVRINSACLTSEAFGDDRCDCAWQMWEALRMIQAAGCGLVIYSISDEGRGVGIFHKINSIELMDRLGVDSASAFRKLGLPIDRRSFGYPALILETLGVSRVRLISNNPEKVAALEQNGIGVDERLSVVASHDDNLRSYLASKKHAFNHFIDI